MESGLKKAKSGISKTDKVTKRRGPKPGYIRKKACSYCELPSELKGLEHCLNCKKSFCNGCLKLFDYDESCDNPELYFFSFRCGHKNCKKRLCKECENLGYNWKSCFRTGRLCRKETFCSKHVEQNLLFINDEYVCKNCTNY